MKSQDSFQDRANKTKEVLDRNKDVLSHTDEVKSQSLKNCDYVSKTLKKTDPIRE